MTRRRRSEVSASTEESSGLAGWLYTDLLLGLAVVFLGTISFSAFERPDDGGATSNSSTTSTTSTTIAATTTTVEPEVPTFQLSCNQFYIDSNILRDTATDEQLFLDVTGALDAAMKVNNWTSKTARVGFVLLFGGFSREYGEGPEQGASRAANFQERLRKVVPMLAAVEMSSSGSSSKNYEGTTYRVGGRGEYAMLVFFAYQGDPAVSGCGS